MAEHMKLDDILSDKPVEKQAPKAEPAPAPAQETAKEPAAPAPSNSLRREHQKREFEAQGRDPDTGKFIAKEEPKAEPAKPAAPQQEEMTAKEKAAFAKAADETRKRQALEARIRELEAKVPAAPQEPAKTFWDDPEAALKQQQAAVQQAIVGTKLQTSEAIARSRHADFDEKVAIFSELAQSTPGLAQQMLASPDPAEFVYRTATNHKALQDAGGLDEMRKKIEAETETRVRARLEAELKDKAEALAKERAALPGSLSDAQSKGTHRPSWSGPTPLGDILKP